MHTILGWQQSTQLVRPPTKATTARAISINDSWLRVMAESQSLRGLLQQRSSIKLSHQHMASSSTGTTTMTEEGLSALL